MKKSDKSQLRSEQNEIFCFAKFLQSEFFVTDVIVHNISHFSLPTSTFQVKDNKLFLLLEVFALRLSFGELYNVYITQEIYILRQSDAVIFMF